MLLTTAFPPGVAQASCVVVPTHQQMLRIGGPDAHVSHRLIRISLGFVPSAYPNCDVLPRVAVCANLQQNRRRPRAEASGRHGIHLKHALRGLCALEPGIQDPRRLPERSQISQMPFLLIPQSLAESRAAQLLDSVLGSRRNEKSCSPHSSNRDRAARRRSVTKLDFGDGV